MSQKYETVDQSDYFNKGAILTKQLFYTTGYFTKVVISATERCFLRVKRVKQLFNQSISST